MEEKNAKVIAEKYKNGTCSPEELALIDQWYNQQTVSGRYPDVPQIQRSMDEVWSRIAINQPSKRTFWKSYVAVSAVVLAVLSTWYYTGNVADTSAQQVDAMPGRQQAVLTLSSGRAVQLSEKNGGLSFQKQTIQYTNGVPMLEYTPLLASHTAYQNYVFTNTLNTIEVPLGGNYQIILSDGSIVWLNSGSKLTFPTSFATASSREVSLSGEAFFAVSKDPEHRFTVNTRDQQINVLGTKFNVEAYPEQKNSKTTLLEGAVEIINMQAGEHFGKKIILTPHEQTHLDGKNISKEKVNTEKTIAWKDGLFVFNDDRLIDIMQILSRWYKVDIDYNSIPESRFNGQISKQVKLSEVLEMLEITGQATFKLENNVIRAYSKDSNINPETIN